MQPLLLLALAGWGSTLAPPAHDDPRDRYDVLAYRLDLRIDPARRRLSGEVAVELRVLERGVRAIRLDLMEHMTVENVRSFDGPLTPSERLGGRPVVYEREREWVDCLLLDAPPRKDQVLTVVVRYSGQPTSLNSFSGFHWRETPDGRPWIDTSVQNVGAHYWWPCKASFYNPEDKCAALYVNATVPEGLIAVSNGRLDRRSKPRANWETFHWRHPYPVLTNAVAINVGPFVEVSSELELAGIAGAVPFSYFVLADSLKPAEVQFSRVSEILDVFAQRFGPYPFAESKVGIVESTFLGMDHSTSIAYGSSYPDWLERNGLEDPYPWLNKGYDSMLVHSLAHEWWGHSVSAASWTDYWLHEGFSTYAECVYLEATAGREAADAYFKELSSRVGSKSRLHPGGMGQTAKEAYSTQIYYKGACVLDTLRHYIDDDEAWWQGLRDFQEAYRYGNATTDEFRAILDAATDRSWKSFFDEWVYGTGYPRLSGTVKIVDGRIVVEVDNEVSEARVFHVPLDLEWREGDRVVRHRLMLRPGPTKAEIECDEPPSNVEVVHLNRVLGRHRVRVECD